MAVRMQRNVVQTKVLVKVTMKSKIQGYALKYKIKGISFFYTFIDIFMFMTYHRIMKGVVIYGQSTT